MQPVECFNWCSEIQLTVLKYKFYKFV